MKKKRVHWILITICILGGILFIYKVLPLIKQEKDFLAIVIGICKLHVKDSNLICYKEDDTHQYYVSKTTLGIERKEPIETLLNDRGYTFVEQMGSGYMFEGMKNNEERIIVTSRQFSRYYNLWQVSRE